MRHPIWMLLTALIASLAVNDVVHAQETAARNYRIGLITYAGDADGSVGATGKVMKRELGKLGYREGVNVTYMERAGQRDYAATQRSAAELVAWHADVVVSFMSNADIAMLEATAQSQTPVVFWSADPLEEKLIKSYHHPGTNFTGFSYEPHMQFLEVRVLKLLVPKLKLLCHLYNHTYAPAPSTLRDLRVAAEMMGVTVKVYEVLTTEKFASAIATMHADKCDALYIGPHELFNTHGRELGDLVLKYKLPTMGLASIATTGGVAAYLPPFERGWPTMAVVVDKILKDAKPADIPIERSIKSPLMLNLRSINALGLTVSDSLLDEADEVTR